MPDPNGVTYRFHDFELLTRPYRLRRDGEDVALQPQPARALELLVSRAGDVVSRDDLREHLWGHDVHVEHGPAINFTIRKVRSTLGDDAQSPRFIETIPRQGYRFVASVERSGDTESDEPPPEAESRLPRPRIPRTFAALAVLLVVAWVGWIGLGGTSRSGDEATQVPAFESPGEPSDDAVVKLAVLPLEARADDEPARALADVLSEELAAHLASRLAPRKGAGAESGRRRGLAVVTPRAARAVRGEEPDVAARRLGADLVLGGTLVNESDGVRLSARLWRPADRVTVWADTFEAVADEVDGVWERIAHGVGGAVGLRLSSDAVQIPASLLTADQQSELWQAKMLVRRGGVESVEEGIRRLEELSRAAAEAPDVFVALADAWMIWSAAPSQPFGKPFQEFFPQVEAAARRALELNPAQLDAWVHLAAVRFNIGHDWEETRRILEEEVLRRSPRHASALHLYGILLCSIGRFDEGIATIRKAVELDPVTLFVTSDLATAYFMARRYGEAIDQARRNLELDLDDIGNTWLMAEALRRQDRDEEAIETLRLHYQRRNIEIAGFDDLLPRVTRYLADMSSAGHPTSVVTARNKLMLGEVDAGLSYLERACDGHPDFQLPWVGVDPAFDDVRNHPRYRALEKCLAPVESAPPPAAGKAASG